MGLDMYIYKRRKGRSAENETEVAYWRKANQIHNFFDNNLGEGCGVENCRYYLVSEEVLNELLNVCNKILEMEHEFVDTGKTVNILKRNEESGKPEIIEQPIKVIKDPSKIEELLPTIDGFFFGDTDYDEYYLEDIEDTKEILEKILKETNFEKEELYYYAWW